jgi:DNA-binding MarR family transcriptional regulator
MPLTHITAFLFVAIDEGKGVGEYARMAGVHRAAMSRTLRDIGARNRRDEPGHGLVQVQPHPTINRKTQVVLTEKGRAIVDQIVK